MKRNRFAEFTLLLSCATSLCLTLVFVLWTDEEGRSLFGSIGYCGALIYFATSACLDIQHRGGMGPLLRWGIAMMGVVLATFALTAVPVALSPRVGDPGFDPHDYRLVLFELIWNAFQVNLSGLVILIALTSTRGWANYLETRGGANRQHSMKLGEGKPLRRGILIRLMLLGYLGFLAVGCLVATPGYTFPLLIRLMSGGFLVGIVLASHGQAQRRVVGAAAPSTSEFAASVALFDSLGENT